MYICMALRRWSSSSLLPAEESYIQSLFWTFPIRASSRCDDRWAKAAAAAPAPARALTTDPVKPHSQTSLDPPKPGARAKPQALERPEWSRAEPGCARPIKKHIPSHQTRPQDFFLTPTVFSSKHRCSSHQVPPTSKHKDDLWGTFLKHKVHRKKRKGGERWKTRRKMLWNHEETNQL